jgi:hypothetical protein
MKNDEKLLLITNPILIAEAIANIHGVSPELVFISKKPKYRYIRKEWIITLLKLNYSKETISLITKWKIKEINRTLYRKVEGSYPKKVKNE